MASDRLLEELSLAYELYRERRSTVNIDELRRVLDSLGEGRTTASGLIGKAVRDFDQHAGELAVVSVGDERQRDCGLEASRPPWHLPHVTVTSPLTIRVPLAPRLHDPSTRV